MLKKKIFLYIAVNIAVFCTLIVLIEVAGQTVYYLTHGKPIYQSDQSGYGSIFEFHPFLVVRLKKNIKVDNETNGTIITTTNNHTRWTGANDDDSDRIRVAVLGGSTTFGTMVIDGDSWPALLQSYLGDQFSVGNYGVPNYTTAEAIIQTAFVLPETKPDFVIFYEGWNDFFQYHNDKFTPDYYEHGMDMYGRLSVPMNANLTLLERLNEFSAIARLATKIKHKLTKPPADTCKTFNTPDPLVDRTYARNLDTLRVLSERIAPYTIFVPQILNYHKFIENQENESCDWHAAGHTENRAAPELMDRFNLLMEEACPKDDSKCIFVEAVSKVKWEPDDFMDWGHFSRKGGEKFAKILSEVILSKAREGNLYNDRDSHASPDNLRRGRGPEGF